MRVSISGGNTYILVNLRSYTDGQKPVKYLGGGRQKTPSHEGGVEFFDVLRPAPQSRRRAPLFHGYINTRGELEAHESINRFWCRLRNINKTLVDANLKLVPGVLVYEG